MLSGFVSGSRKILAVGVPASLSNAVNPAGMALVTAAVATISDEAVAGFGAAGRAQSILLVPLMALSAGIGPVVGQNWGAKETARVQKATKLAYGSCFAYGALIGAVLLLFAEQIAGLLAASQEDLDFAATYLRIVGVTMFGYGVVVITNAAMNARNKAVWSMSLSLGRIFIIYLPLAWVGATMYGYIGIVVAAALANIVGAVAAVAAAYKTGIFAITSKN
jgi:Na+-driven multidrug efflux pump